MRARTGRLSRRAFLGGAIALGAVGCRHHTSAPPDPDAARVTAARDSELQIIAMYTALASVAGPQQPAYVRLLDLHRQHLHALVDAQMTPVVEGVATAKAASALVAASVAPLQSAAVAAVSGQRAALLASIAASHVAQGSNATTPGRVS